MSRHRPTPTALSTARRLSPAGVLLLALAGLVVPAVRAAAGAPPAATDADAAVRKAAEAGDERALAAALAAGGRPDQAGKFGVSLLMTAAGRGEAEIVDRLLSAGATVDGINTWNETALAYAVRSGNPRVVARLLAAGADVNHRARHGFTPLVVAVASGRLDVVRQLLAAGADPNATIEGDATPLQLAAGQGGVEIARALLAAGARLDARDEAGRDALTIAVEGGHADAIAFFEKATGRKMKPRAATRVGAAAAEIGDVDFRTFVYTLEGHPVEVTSGLHPARDARDLAVDSVSEVLGDLGGDGTREAALLVGYRLPGGEERTQTIVYGVRDGRLVELGRLPAGTVGKDSQIGVGFHDGNLRVERERPGAAPANEDWRHTAKGFEQIAAAPATPSGH